MSRKFWATAFKDRSEAELVATWRRAYERDNRKLLAFLQSYMPRRGIEVPIADPRQRPGTIPEPSRARDPREMSTHAIKTELHALLVELRPDQKWHKRTRALDLVEFALDDLPVESDDARVQRARELAHVVMPRLGHT